MAKSDVPQISRVDDFFDRFTHQRKNPSHSGMK
jgi:hypothetical protein